jgi:hypothetical protein
MYEDPQRPGGVEQPNAPPPSWLTETMDRITKAIFDVVHYSQHEYLDHRRLPHAIKMSEVLVKPHLLKTGEVAVATVFPVASELTFVAYFTPLFAKPWDLLTQGNAPEDNEVVDYRIFAYKEGVHSVVHNVPQNLADWLQVELKRQALELKIRNPQFLYFTIMKPMHTEAFEDPHGYNKQDKQAPAGIQMPTEL